MNAQMPQYLGDGVYAAHDGYQVLLRVGDHYGEPVVALEPAVILHLVEYARQQKLIK